MDIDDPMAKTFSPFGDARWKITGGNAIKSHEMYFATYQSIAADSNRPGLFREFPADFFDAIIIDECHRGSSREARTDAVAKHLTEFLKRTDRFAKTIVFCVDQEHADEMRRALNNLNSDLVRDYPDYVCRVTFSVSQD